MRGSSTTVAILAVLALAGCFQPPAVRLQPNEPCTTFADCLFLTSGPLDIVIYESSGMALSDSAYASLAIQVDRFSNRGVRSVHESMGPLPDRMDEPALRALIPDDRAGRLNIFVLNTTVIEGGEPTSGVAFPGVPSLFLFPKALDVRVAQAELTPRMAEMARDVVERVVLVHGFGHALGLVGCGLPMRVPHSDQAVTCHSSNATSLMQPRVAHVDEWPPWDEDAPFGPFDFDVADVTDVLAYRNMIRP